MLDKKKSEQVIIDANKIIFNEKQEKVFELVAKGLTAAFPDIRPVVIRGLLRLAIKDWQQENQVTLPEVDSWPLEKRLQVTRGILDNFNRRFYLILRAKTNDAQTLINKKVDQIFQKYVQFAKAGYKDSID